MRKALIVGIDHYDSNALEGCVADAKAIAEVLRRHDDSDESKNFDVKLLTSDDTDIETGSLHKELKWLFEDGDAEMVVFYFAGHGEMDEITNAGFLVTQDGKEGAWGVRFSDVVRWANRAYQRIGSSVIIIDACNSGALGDDEGSARGNAITEIGKGVTILTSALTGQAAEEADSRGVFTEQLVFGLQGAAADLLGRVTPASLYAHIDQSLSALQQRPVYKANVQRFITLREVNPSIPLRTMRRLPKYFQSPDLPLPLDPAYEPNRDNGPKELLDLPHDLEKEKIFADLQIFRARGLVEPVGTEHMYYAAIESKSCVLTELGKHYWKLAKNDYI